MSQQDSFEEDIYRRNHGKPYTAKHPVPTVQGYRQHRAELEESLKETEAEQDDQDRGNEEQESKVRRAYESVKAIAKGDDQSQPDHNPYPTSNHNVANRPMKEGDDAADTSEKGVGDQPGSTGKDQRGSTQGDEQGKSATEAAASHIDPKQKRRDMKKIKRTGGGREVTDPVTHLPVIIHDQTDKDLQNAPENEPSSGAHVRSYTGLSGASKSQNQLSAEQTEMQRGHEGMKLMFPPPEYDDTRNELAKAHRSAMVFGIGSVVALAILALALIQLLDFLWVTTDHPAIYRWLTSSFILLLAGGAGFAITMGVSGWLSNKVTDIWDDETWDSARQKEIKANADEAELPESVAWLNSLLASVWPLINPDLFASIIDMLEDVMQASLPRAVRMVSIDDLGQGGESIRILGMRWLPTGAASQSVDEQGNLKKREENKQSDRLDSGEGEIDGEEQDDYVDEKPKAKREDEQERKQRQQEQQAIREGMEAEEGDFVNMELAFAYRARSSGKSLKSKVQNAHLYLKFYLPGGIFIPVWVELRGIVGTMRLRLQLSPDPPFFSLCTLTFLGQPRANLSCVPLSKHNLNIMDVPLISSFVQSSIDAALAEYVAPKSLTLDLKDMLVGDDFKKDTVTRGVVLLFIKKARGFKEGDGGIGPIRGSSDSYVTVSWGKFGKPVASTRIIENTQEPDWGEWSSILVTPDELNAEESLRVQLWDSDKLTADDDLGRVEIPLKELMHSPQTQNKMCDREDELHGETSDEKMPGTLTWSVGYYAKTRILQSQLDKQTVHPKIRSKEALKKFVAEEAEHKLREAHSVQDESSEIHQQKAQDYKEQEDAMIISTAPPDDFLSGIFSIQIHNITGLEVQRLNKKSKSDQTDREDDAEQSDDLPDSYATIILNHQKIYRTRTKPKNAKPFFNAGTERFVKDWKSAEVMISVRDAREREDDALLGVVYLPLRKVFRKTSQVASIYPLAGGIGYGRARISMVWRSVELKMPKELIGWDYGTLEIKAPVTTAEGSSIMNEVDGCRIKLRTNLGKSKLYPAGSHSRYSISGTSSAGQGEWRPKGKRQDESSFLAVRKRYASCLLLEWRKSSIGLDSSPAFAVLWLSELADEEEKTVALKVWKGGKDNLRRAESCCNYQGLDHDEQSVGEIKLTVKFWRGLSGYHKRHAQKSGNDDLRDIMEVLDTICDEKIGEEEGDDGQDWSGSDSDSDSGSEPVSKNGHPEPTKQTDNHTNSNTASDIETKRKLRIRSTEDSSDSESDPESKSAVKTLKEPVNTIKEKVGKLLDGQPNGDEDDGSRGLRSQVQDYKRHHKQLHRKHRGVMQWKSARTLDWMVGKVKRGKGRIEGVFEHTEKGQGIETEV